MKKAPGSTLIMVVAILFLVFGILAAIGLAGIGALLAYAAVGGAVIVLSVILSVLMVVLEIIAGILGIRFCNNLFKADFLFKYSVVLLIVAIISLIFGIVTSGVAWTSFVGLVLPILYLVGANMNKNAEFANPAG